MQLSLNLPICIQSGDCGLCDILTFIGSVFELLIVLLAAGAFIMLLVGSIYFVLSRGNPETRKKGINILTSVTAGVFIGLLAWQIVNLTIFILVGNNKFDETGQPVKYKVFGNPWNEVCTGESFRSHIGCVAQGGEFKKDGENCGSGGKCQNGVCIDSKADLAECLGKSNGSPCANGSRHCENGLCVSKSSCEYLSTASQYTDKFGSRTILDSNRVAQPLQKYQCINVKQEQGIFTLDDPPPSGMQANYPHDLDSNTSITLDCMDSLCPGDKLCCGEVAGN